MFTLYYGFESELREARWHLPLRLYLPLLPTYRIDTHTVPGLGARLAIITNEAVGCAPASEQLHLTQRPVRRTVLIFTCHFSLARPGVVGAPSDPLTSPGVRGVVGALGEP